MDDTLKIMIDLGDTQFATKLNKVVIVLNSSCRRILFS